MARRERRNRRHCDLLGDVAERKKAEEALREQGRCRAIFEKAGNGIGIADREGRLQQANPALCQMLGYSREELVGSRVFDLVHPDDQAANFSAFQQLRRGEVSALELKALVLEKGWGIGLGAQVSLAAVR